MAGPPPKPPAHSKAPWRATLRAAVLAGLAGCHGPAMQPEAVNPMVLAAARQASECRAAIAKDPLYQPLAAHMPLVEIDQSTLPQMTDTRLITPDELAALYAWHQDVKTCGDQVIDTANRTLPAIAPIVMEGRANDDAVLVLLAQRKLAWGAAVVRLRANRAQMFAKVADRTSALVLELTRSQEAEYARRTSVVNTLIRIIP